VNNLDDQEYLIRGALARELGDIMDSDAETLVQNTVALTDAVMAALHGRDWRSGADEVQPCEASDDGKHTPGNIDQEVDL
jgi:hypothetical protein